MSQDRDETEQVRAGLRLEEESARTDEKPSKASSGPEEEEEEDEEEGDGLPLSISAFIIICILSYLLTDVQQTSKRIRHFIQLKKSNSGHLLN